MNKKNLEEYIAQKFPAEVLRQRRREVVQFLPPIVAERAMTTTPLFMGEKAAPTTAPITGPVAMGEVKRCEESKADVRLSLTLTHEVFDKLKRLQDLEGISQLSDAVDLALEFYLKKNDPLLQPEKKERAKENKAKVEGQMEEKNEKAVIAAPETRRVRKYLPKALRVAVWKRDEGRCTYVGREGKRCDARRHLQFDHKVPFSLGGPDSEENIGLMCGVHNCFRWRDEMDFAAKLFQIGKSATYQLQR